MQFSFPKSERFNHSIQYLPINSEPYLPTSITTFLQSSKPREAHPLDMVLKPISPNFPLPLPPQETTKYSEISKETLSKVRIWGFLDKYSIILWYRLWNLMTCSKLRKTQTFRSLPLTISLQGSEAIGLLLAKDSHRKKNGLTLFLVLATTTTSNPPATSNQLFLNSKLHLELNSQKLKDSSNYLPPISWPPVLAIVTHS